MSDTKKAKVKLKVKTRFYNLGSDHVFVNTPKYTELTATQKLKAFAMRYYNNVSWTSDELAVGDYYTTTREDLELYEIVHLTQEKVYTRYCSWRMDNFQIAEWDRKTFTSEGFGPYRMFVPLYVLEKMDFNQIEDYIKSRQQNRRNTF